MNVTARGFACSGRERQNCSSVNVGLFQFNNKHRESPGLNCRRRCNGRRGRHVGGMRGNARAHTPWFLPGGNEIAHVREVDRDHLLRAGLACTDVLEMLKDRTLMPLTNVVWHDEIQVMHPVEQPVNFELEPAAR